MTNYIIIRQGVKILSLALLSLLSMRTDAQSVFQKTYGGTGRDSANAIINTYDSSLLFTGMYRTGSANSDFYLLKTDQDGQLIWSYNYHFGDIDGMYGLTENTSDAKYAIVGETRDKISITVKYDACMLITDTAGSMQNFVYYGSSETNEHARSVTFSGEQYAWAGFSNDCEVDSNCTTNDVYLGIINQDATPQNITKIDINSGNDFGQHIISYNENYYITGYTKDQNSQLYKTFLMKTQNNGTVDWVKLYGDSAANTFAYSLKLTPDTGLILIGHTNSNIFQNGKTKAMVIKTDINGDEQWTGLYATDSSFVGRDIIVGVDSMLYCTGYGYSDTLLNQSLYVFKLDQNGNFIWGKAYGGTQAERGYGVTIAKDGVVATGKTNSYGQGFTDAYLVKSLFTDTLLCADSLMLVSDTVFADTTIQADFTQEEVTIYEIADLNFDVQTNQDSVCYHQTDTSNEESRIFNGSHHQGETILIYPNPADQNSSLQIFAGFLKDEPYGPGEVTIYSVLGTQVYYCEIKGTYGLFTLNNINLAKGLYYLRFSSNGSVQTKIIRIE